MVFNAATVDWANGLVYLKEWQQEAPIGYSDPIVGRITLNMLDRLSQESGTISPPTVTITEDANNDGIINAAELAGDIDVSVGLPTGAVEDDIITVTDGITPQSIVLTGGDVTANLVTTTFTNPGDGSTISVTATLTDAVGNVSADSVPDSALIHSSALEAPTVTITEDANNDGIISAAELAGHIDVSVGLPTGAVEDDIITVTDGITPQSIVLTGGDVTANLVTTTFTNPGDGSTISVTATLKDALGNVSADSVSDSALIDSSTVEPPVSSQTVYEDAEAGNTDKWNVYDNSPAGALILNVFDETKNSNVIEFSGSGTENGYRLGHYGVNNTNAWNNSSYKNISWDSRFSDSFKVYIATETTLGFRYLYYTTADSDRGILSSTYIHHGIGSNTRNGAWHTINRDLEADLQEFEPTNRILSVNGFLIRGSGRIDNIVLQ